LSVARGKLYVADTNNHAVRVVDLKTTEATTLKIKGLEPPASSSTSAATASTAAPNLEEIKLTPQRLRARAEGALIVDVMLPAGYHLNPSAPQRYQIAIESGAQYLMLGSDPKTGMPAWRDKTLVSVRKDLRLPLRIALNPFAAGKAELRVQLTLFYCREDNTGTCQIKTLVWRAPVEVIADASAPSEIKVQGKIEAQ